jgi:CheY-like chemotaxis protein
MSKKILIVDDEEDLREILEFHVESNFDNPIVFAHNGAHAVDVLNSDDDIGLIVCDYSMPVENGAFVFNHNINTKNVPFILLTGQELKDCNDIIGFHESNEKNAVVKKPWQDEILLSVISECLKE